MCIIVQYPVCFLLSILLDNPLVCDCDAKWLYEFLLDNRLSGPVCGSPQELRGRNLLDLEQGEFCGQLHVNTYIHVHVFLEYMEMPFTMCILHMCFIQDLGGSG